MTTIVRTRWFRAAVAGLTLTAVVIGGVVLHGMGSARAGTPPTFGGSAALWSGPSVAWSGMTIGAPRATIPSVSVSADSAAADAAAAWPVLMGALVARRSNATRPKGHLRRGPLACRLTMARLSTDGEDSRSTLGTGNRRALRDPAIVVGGDVREWCRAVSGQSSFWSAHRNRMGVRRRGHWPEFHDVLKHYPAAGGCS